MLKKQISSLAIDICSKFSLEDKKSQEILDTNIGVSEFLEALRNKGLYRDAIRFLSHALPKREAIWWSCVCIRSSDIILEKQNLDSLETTEDWVRTLSEENRLKARDAALIEKLETPTSWAAISAFWSQGSIAPPSAPIVLASESLSPNAVSGAIILAGVLQNPQNSSTKYENFLQKGIDIGNEERG